MGNHTALGQIIIGVIDIVSKMEDTQIQTFPSTGKVKAIVDGEEWEVKITKIPKREIKIQNIQSGDLVTTKFNNNENTHFVYRMIESNGITYMECIRAIWTDGAIKKLGDNPILINIKEVKLVEHKRYIDGDYKRVI